MKGTPGRRALGGVSSLRRPSDRWPPAGGLLPGALCSVQAGSAHSAEPLLHQEWYGVKLRPLSCQQKRLLCLQGQILRES